MTPSDPDLWSKVATACAGVAGTLAGWAWKDMKSDVRRLEAQLANKVDISEMDKQRENITSIFDKMEDHGRRMEGMYSKVIDLINNRHIELMNKLDTKQDKRKR